MIIKSLTLAAALLVTAASTVAFVDTAQAQAANGRGGGGGAGAGPNGGGGGAGGDGSGAFDIVPRVPNNLVIARVPPRNPPTIVARSRAPQYSFPHCSNNMTPSGFMSCGPQ
ncbi:MAG: hypothetical protein ACRCTI_20645 [Beijerinckiaceae bacterium]